MNFNRAIHRKHRYAAGSVVTETAIVLPILLALVVGVLEFSHFYFTKSELQAALEAGLEQATVVPNLEDNAPADTSGTGPFVNQDSVDKVLRTVLTRGSVYFSNGTDFLNAEFPKKTSGRVITGITFYFGQDQGADLSRWLQENPMTITLEANVPSLFGFRPAELVTLSAPSLPYITINANNAAFRESELASSISRVFNCQGQELTADQIAQGTFNNLECACEADPNDPSLISVNGVCDCATALGYARDINTNEVVDALEDPEPQLIPPDTVDPGECICNSINGYTASPTGNCECLDCSVLYPDWRGVIPVPSTLPEPCECTCPAGLTLSAPIGDPPLRWCFCSEGTEDLPCGCPNGYDEEQFDTDFCVPLGYYEDPNDGECRCEPKCTLPAPWMENPSDPRECQCDSSFDCTAGTAGSQRVLIDDGERCECECPVTTPVSLNGPGEPTCPSNETKWAPELCACVPCDSVGAIQDPDDPTRCGCVDCDVDDDPQTFNCIRADSCCTIIECDGSNFPNRYGYPGPGYVIPGNDTSSGEDCSQEGNCICDVERLFEEVCEPQGKIVDPDVCDCVGCVGDGTVGDNPTECDCDPPTCGGSTFLCARRCECLDCPENFDPIPYTPPAGPSSESCNTIDRCECNEEDAFAECPSGSILLPDCTCGSCPVGKIPDDSNAPAPPTECICPDNDGEDHVLQNPIHNYYCRDDCTERQCTPPFKVIDGLSYSCFSSDPAASKTACECDPDLVINCDSPFQYVNEETCECEVCNPPFTLTGNVCECQRLPTECLYGSQLNVDSCECECIEFDPVQCPAGVGGPCCNNGGCDDAVQNCAWRNGVYTAVE